MRHHWHFMSSMLRFYVVGVYRHFAPMHKKEDFEQLKYFAKRVMIFHFIVSIDCLI